MVAAEQRKESEEGEGRAPPRRPAHRRLVTGSAILAGLAGLMFLLAGFGAPCGPGQTCVSSAGLSLALPSGWSVAERKDAEFFRAKSTSPKIGIVIQRGDAILDTGPYRTLDEVAAAIEADYAAGTGEGFVRISGSVVDRQMLPTGPAVRWRSTTNLSFIFSFNQSSAVYLFFLDDQLLELEYLVAHGEGYPSMPPEAEIGDLRTILDSLRPMTAATRAGDRAMSVVPWLLAASLGLLGAAAVRRLRGSPLPRGEPRSAERDGLGDAAG